MRKPWNTYSIIYFFFFFAQHFAIITLSQKNTDKTNSLVSDGHDSSDCCQLMETIILFFCKRRMFLFRAMDTIYSILTKIFYLLFFSNHGNLTKKRTYSNSGKFQTSKCGILLPLVYYWNLFPVFFFVSKQRTINCQWMRNKMFNKSGSRCDLQHLFL